MLISPWEIPSPGFQPDQSSPLLGSYFCGTTRLEEGPGAFPLQGSHRLRQAPPSPSAAWGRSNAGSPPGPACSDAAPTGELSALLDCMEPAQGPGQGSPPSATSSAEYPALALPRRMGWRLKPSSSSRSCLERFLFGKAAWGRTFLQVIGASPLAEVRRSSSHASLQVNCTCRT